MEYRVLIRAYKGMYFVEFNSKSLGCTLLATWDKTQAQAECERFKGMTEKQMREYLLAR